MIFKWLNESEIMMEGGIKLKYSRLQGWGKTCI